MIVGNFVCLGVLEAFLVEAGLLRAGGLPGILRPVVDDDSD
jgi:hypothetical protein